MSSNTIFGYIIVVLSIGHQLLSVQIKLSVSPQDGAEKNRDDEQILKNSSIFHVDGEQKLIIWKTLNEKVQVSKQASWVKDELIERGWRLHAGTWARCLGSSPMLIEKIIITMDSRFC